MERLKKYSYDEYTEFIKANKAKCIAEFSHAPFGCPVVGIYKTESGRLFLHWLEQDSNGYFIYLVATISIVKEKAPN